MLTEVYLPRAAGDDPPPERALAALEAAKEGLLSIPDSELLEAWADTVETFRDPASEESRSLRSALLATTGLSPAGLEA
ncbi:MAG: hypothetical protein KDD47_18480, partial [Acidobacteria bacterium]|nr:hypothetical protein [Acidobacteriota bacterium]